MSIFLLKLKNKVMNKGEYFKIETVEELKEAYEMFKDEWWGEYPLEREIGFFTKGKSDVNYRFIVKNHFGICLNWNIEGFKEIGSPLKKQKNISIIRAEEFNFNKELPDEFSLVVHGEGFESFNVRNFIECTHRLISTSVAGRNMYYLYKSRSMDKKPRQIVMIEDLMDTPLLKDEFILVEPGKINKEQEKLYKGRHFMLGYSYNQIDFWWDTSGQYKHYHYKRDESIIEKPNLKEKTSLQKTLEIGELNIHILKALTTNNLVESSLTGAKAQEIVDKIEELSKIILK